MPEFKQVNYRFDKKVVDMLDALIEHYSMKNEYMKYTKTNVMQYLIQKDYEEKINNKNIEEEK